MKIRNIILTLLLLTSCKPNYPFRFNDKYYGKSELIELSNLEDYLSLEKEKESFGIYIYIPGCVSCAKFKPIVEEFINTYNITLYSISYAKLKLSKNDLTDNIKYAPSVALVSNGKLVTYLDTDKDEHISYYENINDFTIWFKSYVEI